MGLTSKKSPTEIAFEIITSIILICGAILIALKNEIGFLVITIGQIFLIFDYKRTNKSLYIFPSVVFIIINLMGFYLWQ